MRTVLVLALLLVGCGGSSSETPPPLEPDPTSYRYSGPRMPRQSDVVASAAEPELEEPSAPVAKTPARETWGDGSAKDAQPAPASSTQGIEFQ